MIRSAIQLWTECARDAGGAVARSPLVLVVLWLVVPAQAILAQWLAGVPMLGGFVIGFVHAAAAGWYLSLVEIAVNGKRRVDFQDIQEQAGAYVWNVISVLFVFFIAELLLLPFPALLGLVVVGATIAFNPAPEMIWQERLQGTDLLAAAARFMQDNWPEWLFPHVAAAAFVGLTGLVMAGTGYALVDGLHAIATFGPFFGFVGPNAFTIPILRKDLAGLLLGLLNVGFIHFFMLFRAYLYRRLRGTNRRGREWSARARG